MSRYPHELKRKFDELQINIPVRPSDNWAVNTITIAQGHSSPLTFHRSWPDLVCLLSLQINLSFLDIGDGVLWTQPRHTVHHWATSVATYIFPSFTEIKSHCLDNFPQHNYFEIHPSSVLKQLRMSSEFSWHFICCYLLNCAHIFSYIV